MESRGISFGGLLGTVFVILKLTGVIAWSWWLVTMPFWIGLPIAAIIAVLAGLVVLIKKI